MMAPRDTVPSIPREAWPEHPRYPAQTLLLGSHEAFRKHAASLIERVHVIAPAREPKVAKRRRWMVRASGDFDWWMSGMRGHERYEETKLYPYLARRYGASFSALEAGHADLHRHKERVEAAFQSYYAGDPDEHAFHDAVVFALERHRAALLDHLEAEERYVIPMLLELAPEEFHRFTTTPARALLGGRE